MQPDFGCLTYDLQFKAAQLGVSNGFSQFVYVMAYADDVKSHTHTQSK